MCSNGKSRFGSGLVGAFSQDREGGGETLMCLWEGEYTYGWMALVEQ